MFEYFQSAPWSVLMLGLATGFVFGFLLQRGGVTRYKVILGQFLWADHTVLRVMLTAVAVGAIGVWTLHGLYGVPLHLKTSALVANTLGGIIFGVGMALLGYCPGTGVGAVGDGSCHAIFGVLGMFAGAGVYAEVYPFIQGNLLSMADLGKVTWSDLTGIPVSVMVGLVVLFVLVVLYNLRDRPQPSGDARSTQPG